MIAFMSTPLEQKSSLEEIEKRFDNDVDRFSNLATGQSATVDAPLAMELITNGGSIWITDLVSHESDAVHSLMWERYGEYLCSLGGADYRTKVFEYIDKEDSPKPVTYQLDLLRKVGFRHIDLLHKNSCFAAFGATKTG